MAVVLLQNKNDPKEVHYQVQKEFDKRIEQYFYNFYFKSLGLFDWKDRLDCRKKEGAMCRATLRTVEKISGLDLKNKKMLDVGCGWGGYTVAGLEMGIDAYGCDIDDKVLEIAALRSKLHGVPENYYIAPAEQLPFPDETFDYVQCISVLEHVNNVSTSIREMVRVLKKGGVAFISAPNYFMPVELHYKVLFPPKCPKRLGKLYLRLLGRPTEFLDTINYIDYKHIKSELEKHSVKIENIERQYNEVFNSLYKPYMSATEEKRRYPFTYNMLISRIIWRITPAIITFISKFFNIPYIYFLIRKY
jgi:ubiquinone/menaquinone biosynthesis C-methylase UbiE